MNLADVETYRDMAMSLRNMAARSDKADKRERLRRLADRCELRATLIESGFANDDSPDDGFGGDAA